MAGRPPKPAAEKKAAGNPGKRPIKDNVAPAVAGPQPPAWVASDMATLAQWNALAPEMIARGTLSLFDVNLFGVYCVVMAEVLRAIAAVRAVGLVQRTKNGVGKSAEFTILMDALKELRGFSLQFGFSPISRTKLFTSEGDEGLSPAEKELRALEQGSGAA